MLDDQISACRACPLGDGTNYCPGEGPIAIGTPIVIGMNPGVSEAEEHRPFVGPSARIRELLTGPIYWTNVVKCAGRVTRCSVCRWISLEINAIRPTKIVLLGAVATKRMTGLAFRPGPYTIPTIYGRLQAWATWHPSPANNYHWLRLQEHCVKIQEWLAS